MACVLASHVGSGPRLLNFDLHLAIQFAQLSGFLPIVTIASARHTEWLLSLGATHVLDRSLAPEDLKQRILEITGGPLPVVYDAVSLADTLALGYAVTADDGDLVTVQQGEIAGANQPPKKRVRVAHGFLQDAENREFVQPFLSVLPDLLEEGTIKVRLGHHRVSLGDLEIHNPRSPIVWKFSLVVSAGLLTVSSGLRGTESAA